MARTESNQPNQRRFNPDFNETDPVTHRPFSGGHPDGVWIIAIILAIPIAIALLGDLGAVIMMIFAKNFLTAGINVLVAFTVTVVVALLLVPPIVLMFRRSRRCITWITGFAAVFALIFVIGFFSSEEISLKKLLEVGGAIGTVIFGIFGYYLFGLKRQELLH